MSSKKAGPTLRLPIFNMTVGRALGWTSRPDGSKGGSNPSALRVSEKEDVRILRTSFIAKTRTIRLH